MLYMAQSEINLHGGTVLGDPLLHNYSHWISRGLSLMCCIVSLKLSDGCHEATWAPLGTTLPKPTLLA